MAATVCYGISGQAILETIEPIWSFQIALFKNTSSYHFSFDFYIARYAQVKGRTVFLLGEGQHKKNHKTEE